MPTLTTTQINALQTKINNGDIAGFYTDLQSYGDAYGTLALSVTNNSTWEAKFSNSFAASGGADNGIDLSYGSSAWTALNTTLANTYLQAYRSNSNSTPIWNTVQNLHNDAYVNAGLDANDWLPNKPLNVSSNPGALWNDLLANQGGSDLWNDTYSVATSGAGILFPPYFTAAALTDPDFVGQIDFARHFWDAFSKLSDSDRLSMAGDVTGISSIADFVNSLPNTANNLLDDIGWAIDNPQLLPLGLPSWLQPLLDPVTGLPGVAPSAGVAGGGVDPLVFDLDGSGTIDLISLASGVHFDAWGDRFAEKTGWAAPADGMLAIDLNANGTIDNIADLFGSQHPLTFLVDANWGDFTTKENGFARLALYDRPENGGNGDGAITAADAVWNSLVMWRDANSDGVSQPGELLTLDALGITAIDVSGYHLDHFQGLSSGTPFSRIIQGNIVTHTGTFTMNGAAREVVDVWYNNDLINTTFKGDYTLDVRTLFLPTARGYGMIPDLHVAANDNFWACRAEVQRRWERLDGRPATGAK